MVKIMDSDKVGRFLRHGSIPRPHIHCDQTELFHVYICNRFSRFGPWSLVKFFGHIVRSDPDEDHTRALNAGIDDPPKDWRRLDLAVVLDKRGCVQ